MSHEGGSHEQSLAERFPNIDFAKAEEGLRAFMRPEVSAADREKIDRIFASQHLAIQVAQKRFAQQRARLQGLLDAAAFSDNPDSQEIDRLSRALDPRTRVCEEILKRAREEGLLTDEDDLDLGIACFLGTTSHQDTARDMADLIRARRDDPGGVTMFERYTGTEVYRRSLGERDLDVLRDPAILKTVLLQLPALRWLQTEGEYWYEALKTDTAPAAVRGLHVVYPACIEAFEDTPVSLSRDEFRRPSDEAVSTRLFSEQLASLKWLWDRWIHPLHQDIGNTQGKVSEPKNLRLVDPLHETAAPAPAWLAAMLSGGHESRKLRRQVTEKSHDQAELLVRQWLDSRNVFAARARRMHPHIENVMQYAIAGELLRKDFPILGPSPFLALLEASKTGLVLMPFPRGAVIALPMIE